MSEQNDNLKTGDVSQSDSETVGSTDCLELEKTIRESVYKWYLMCDSLGFDIDFMETKLIDIINKATDFRLELCR